MTFLWAMPQSVVAIQLGAMEGIAKSSMRNPYQRGSQRMPTHPGRKWDVGWWETLQETHKFHIRSLK
jgi:hypothetical protein